MERFATWEIDYIDSEKNIIKEYSGRYKVKSMDIGTKLDVDQAALKIIDAKKMDYTISAKDRAMQKILVCLLEAPFNITLGNLLTLPISVAEDIMDEIDRLNELTKKAEKTYIV